MEGNYVSQIEFQTHLQEERKARIEEIKLAKERHKQNNKIMEDLEKIDLKLDKMNKINTEVALLKMENKTMKNNIEEIKQLLKEWMAEMDSKFMSKDEHRQFESPEEKFADKDQFTVVQTRLAILIGIISVLGTAVLGILLEKFIK